MRTLKFCRDEGWSLDGASISEDALTRFTEPVYGYDIAEYLADVGPSIADAVESGMIIDLGVAARLYDSSTGNDADLGEIEDLEWLAHRVPREALLSMTRGMIALRAAQQRGVPISERNCLAAIDNLLKAGGELSEQIEELAPAIWETREGEVQSDARGMPTLSDNVTRHVCRESIARAHGIMVDATWPISKLYETYPGVPFLEMIVRYKRIQRDVKRLLACNKRGNGRLHFERVGVDANAHSVFRSPNVHERSVRTAVQSTTDMVQINVGDLDLEIAKRIAARNGKPIWQDITSCAQLGRLANPKGRSLKSLERLGREIVRGACCSDSLAAVAHRYYGGGIVAPQRLANMRRMMGRVLPAGLDPWETEIVARVKSNLLAEDSDKLATMNWGLVSSVVRDGRERWQKLSEADVQGVWTSLIELCREPELRNTLSQRKSGLDVHYDVFCERGVTWNYRVLHCCSRPTAGLWSVYGTMHDVMREIMWLVWRNGGYPLAYHSNQLLVESIDISDCKRIATAAQQRILGGVWCEPEAEVVRRWRL
jgi:hypothetical protein